MSGRPMIADDTEALRAGLDRLEQERLWRLNGPPTGVTIEVDVLSVERLKGKLEEWRKNWAPKYEHIMSGRIIKERP